MELTKRDTDRKAKRTGMLIAVVVHIIIAIIFWNVGGSEIIKDIILDVMEGKTQAPPPPPKPKIKQIEMKKPPAFKPQFDVKSAVKVDPKFAPDFKVMATYDADVSAPDFTMMAQNYSVKTFSLDQSQISNVTTDILKAIGVTDLIDDGRGVKVSGYGKRMRARLNLCLASSPGITIIGDYGLGTSDGSADIEREKNGTIVKNREGASTATAGWDYVYKKYASIDRARVWLKENTQIQVTENTITLNCENTYADWVYAVKKRGALAIDSGSFYFESTAIKRLENALDVLNKNAVIGPRRFIQLVKDAVFAYLADKYEIADPELLTQDVLVKKIEERFLLREWRKRGINEILFTVNRLGPKMNAGQLVQGIKPVYFFFRKAEALENPLLIIANTVGLEKIHHENMAVLRNYVTNGGFLWVDDAGVATENINNQNELARIFIHNLMKFDEKEELTEKEAGTFRKLASDDRNVQGFELGTPFPTFAHPQAFIPITVPRDVPVDIRIFNRLGILVKLFSWSKENPMKAGSYIKKDVALAWNCDNNEGDPVESGNYFIQMQSGLYQKTGIVHVSKLRMLDEKHPLMGIVHSFRNVPVCTIDKGSRYWVTRPYGNAAFGYYYGGRMVILYTEGAGVIAGLGDVKNAVAKEMASKFLNNVIAFCLSDEDGVAIRP